MDTLAKFVAAMQTLPTRGAMLDYHVDKNFNSTNPVSVWSRSVVMWGNKFSKVFYTLTLCRMYIKVLTHEIFCQAARSRGTIIPQ